MNYKPNHSHLSLSDRIAIEQDLRMGMNFKQIGEELSKDPTTISKEIKRAINFNSEKNDPVDCIKIKWCRENKICTKCINMDCVKCMNCSIINCTEICKKHEPKHCKKRMHPPYVCNGCSIRKTCHLGKVYYEAKYAQKRYEELLSNSRKGINMTKDELKELNKIVSPLILQHQSLGHIYATHADEIGVSRASLYRYISGGVLDAKSIDLPRKVRYKKRKKPKVVKSPEYKYRIGRTYKQFQLYTEMHPELDVVEMDTVKGKVGNGKCLLTMLFRSSSLMLIFLLKECTQKEVLRVFNELTKSLGVNKFYETFPVILTDNGSEFKNSLAIETTAEGELRTRIFYCDPSNSNQKSRIERNHELIRYVIPKGKTMKNLSKENVELLQTHINSLKRASLNWHSPYEAASIFLNKEVLDSLNITCVSPDQVQLNPALFK